MDVPVSAQRAFVFTPNGRGKPHTAHTLRQFVAALEHTAPPLLDGYLIRGDFSRWIADVFGDRALADELRDLEARYRSGADGDALAQMASAVRGRYDLGEDELETIGR